MLQGWKGGSAACASKANPHRRLDGLHNPNEPCPGLHKEPVSGWWPSLRETTFAACKRNIYRREETPHGRREHGTSPGTAATVRPNGRARSSKRTGTTGYVTPCSSRGSSSSLCPKFERYLCVPCVREIRGTFAKRIKRTQMGGTAPKSQKI